MEPQTSKEPALHLPQPMPEQAIWQIPVQSNPERLPVVESMPAAQAPAAIPVAPVAQIPALPQTPPPHVPMASAQATVPPTEEEVNRLSVEKAKRIIAQTHTDPYLESEELGKLKLEHVNHIKGSKAAEG